jgi:ASCH domain
MIVAALTVRHPWAAQIMAGTKTTEFRSWRTSHRGTLYIHAGGRLDPEAPEWDGPPLTFGAVLGAVQLTGITGEPGAFAWHLADPVPLDVPVPYPGRLGLWWWER